LKPQDDFIYLRVATYINIDFLLNMSHPFFSKEEAKDSLNGCSFRDSLS